MITSLLYALTNRLPAREINDGERPYLERYYLGTVFGVRLYIHRFVDSDPDRGLHDHPWRWAFSVILSGWYWEETRSGTFMRTRFNFLVGDSFHRVALPKTAIGSSKPVWTLFGHRANRVKRWGFLRGDVASEQTFLPHTPSVEEEWWSSAPSGRVLRDQQAKKAMERAA